VQANSSKWAAALTCDWPPGHGIYTCMQWQLSTVHCILTDTRFLLPLMLNHTNTATANGNLCDNRMWQVTSCSSTSVKWLRTPLPEAGETYTRIINDDCNSKYWRLSCFHVILSVDSVPYMIYMSVCVCCVTSSPQGQETLAAGEMYGIYAWMHACMHVCMHATIQPIFKGQP